MISKIRKFFVIDNQLPINAVTVKDGDTIAHGSHYDFWENLQPKTNIEKKFKTRAHDAYPLGHAIYFTQKKHFVLYADKCLSHDTLKWIADHFCIEEYVAARDRHYQCAACNPFFQD